MQQYSLFTPYHLIICPNVLCLRYLHGSQQTGFVCMTQNKHESTQSSTLGKYIVFAYGQQLQISVHTSLSKFTSFSILLSSSCRPYYPMMAFCIISLPKFPVEKQKTIKRSLCRSKESTFPYKRVPYLHSYHIHIHLSAKKRSLLAMCIQ